MSGAHLEVLGQGLGEQEPDEEQVCQAEEQGQQGGVLVEELPLTGVDREVRPHQRAQGEAQGEGDADHGLRTHVHRNGFSR